MKNKYKYTCFNHLDVFQLVSGYFEFDQWVMINFEKNILVLIILCKLVEIKMNGIEYCKSFWLFTCKKKNKKKTSDSVFSYIEISMDNFCII